MNRFLDKRYYSIDAWGGPVYCTFGLYDVQTDTLQLLLTKHGFKDVHGTA